MLRDSILELRGNGWSYDDIAEKLNCAKSTVCYHCSPKQREYYRERRRKNRRKQLVELKEKHGGKCVECGYSKCLDALHFHHPNDDKDGTVASMLTDTGKAAAYKEAEKCKLVCANCHAEIHAALRSVAQSG